LDIDKEFEEVKPKDRGFDKASEKMVDTSNKVSGTEVNISISLQNMF
jgi:hypothetical protein